MPIMSEKAGSLKRTGADPGPPSIAMVLMQYNPYGGYERQAGLLAGAFARMGYRVTIVSRTAVSEGAAAMDFEKIPVVTVTSWLKVLSFALRSRSFLRKNSGAFDLVVGFDRTFVMDIYRAGNACHRAWLRFRRSQGSWRDAVSIWCNPLHWVINTIERSLFRQIVRNNGTVVALSEVGKRQIQAFYPVSDACFQIIPPAVDFSRFETFRRGGHRERQRRVLGVDQDTVLLLHVGSGFSIKGVGQVLVAIRRLIGDGLRLHYCVVGHDRKGRRRYGAMARDLQVQHAVTFIDGTEAVGAFYAAADVFVMPSLFETFGVAVAEAMFFGLPVVVGSGAGAADLVSDEELGVVVPVPAEAAVLAGAIKATIARERDWCDEGSLEQKRYRRHQQAQTCAQEKVLHRYLALIERKLDEKRASRKCHHRDL